METAALRACVRADELAVLHAAAKARWPDVDVAEDAFVAHLAARVPAGTDPTAALAAIHATDLYLACACERGDPTALAEFERTLLGNAGAFIAHLRLSPELVDELKQRVRERLFVRTGGATAPKIAEYAGRGALGGWLRLVVVRTALSMLRDARPGAALDDAFDELPLFGADPEMDLLKARYRDAFRVAFEAALRALEPEQRNVLRLHHVDGLTIDQLAALCHVHRSTAARQIAAARERILDAARERLGDATGLEATELDSLIGALRSQLDITITRFLRDPA